MSTLLTLISSSGMFDLAIKSLTVMLVACLVAASLRRASAAWRHLVWCLSVASLLLLPVFCLALPAWRVTWLPQWSVQQTSLAVATQTTPVPPIRSEPLPTNSADVILLPSSTQLTTTVDSPALPVAPVETIAAGGPNAWSTTPWLAIAWAAGGLLSLVPLAVGLRQLAVFHRSSRAIEDSRWLALLAELQRQLAVRRNVQLRCSEATVVPLTWGVIRPVLLVPTLAQGWSEERRRFVLLHELAHIRRWDWLTQLVAHFACAAYWFNPLVWLAARQMRIERERACDDLVLAAGASAIDYAQELLTLAASLADSRLSTLVAVPMARRGALEDRLRGILDHRRRRAAITTAAVCLGAALMIAAITPLAMLQAAPTQLPAGELTADDSRPEEKPVLREPAPRDPDLEESADPANGIRISVMNASGDRGIPEFRVIAGVSSGGVASEFEKRTGRTVINWQPHTCCIGKNGGYVWPLEQAYPEMAIRVEADGYTPQVFSGIKKTGGDQQIVCMLAADPGIAGRVRTPDGRPAAGATVALALPQQEIVWEAGALRGADAPLPDRPGDRWRRPRFVKSDQTGGFHLPSEIEPAAVLIVHESGVREMAYDEWKKSPEVTLQRWGNIAGQVLWHDRPGVDEEVSLTIHRDEYGYPGMIASYENVRTDQDGRFTFDRVLPGLVQISRPVKVADAEEISAFNLNGMFQHVKVASEDETRVLLGGQGRKVTGKFVGLDSWEGATHHFHPEAPHIGFPGDNGAWAAFSQLKASSIGPLLFRDKQPINKDGTFTIENMLPGRYQLFVSAPGFQNYAVSAQIQVEPEVPGEGPAPLELKEIAAASNAAKSPEVSTSKSPEKKPSDKPAARTITIRGKVLDDATGEPIGKLIIQGGKFELADPQNVTWGYSEGRSSARDGSFSTTIRWDEGWTARILADGYIPQPVISAAPPVDKDEVEVVIRLRQGPRVRGVVLDHVGKPLMDAAVFAIGPTGLNLTGGQAIDNESLAVRTDAEGRFELPTGEATSLAVSHAAFDAWPAAIPAQGEITIRLPEPARVDVEMDVDGADEECEIFYQLLTQGRPEFKGLRIEREVTIANPGRLSLPALPPGRYQLSRNVMNNLGEIGFGGMLDREFFELKAGETRTINFVRNTGARIKGKVTWPADTKLMGTVISVRSEKAEKGPFDEHEWTTTYASQAAASDGTFHSERILPGNYLLVAEAYLPLTPEQRVRSGMIGPSFRAQIQIEVPADAELNVGELALQPTSADK
jgi:beta-lactamase regulating signal transducer with metallopeptidase domain